MKNKFLSKSVPRGTRTIWRYLSAFILLFSLSIGQMWATDLTITGYMGGSTTTGSVKIHTDTDNMTAICKFANSWSSGANFYSIKTAGGFKSGDVLNFTGAYSNSSSKNAKFVIYAANKTTSLYTSASNVVNGKTSADDPTAESYTLTSDQDSLLFARDGNTGLFLLTLTVSRTTSGPVDPTITFNNSNYTIDGADLDLSSLFTSNSKGAVTYSIKNVNGTGAALRTDGKSFYATIAGTATVTASQAEETGKYNAGSADATITVLNPCTKPSAPTSLGVTSKTHNTANLSWDGGSAGANGYQIALVSASGAGTFDWTDATSATYEATGLTPETAYTFKVKYKGSGEQCAFSDEVTKDFTTDAAPAPTCDGEGTIYSFELKTNLTNGNVYSTSTGSEGAAWTTENFLQSLSGGTLKGKITGSFNQMQFYDNKAVGFTGGTNGSLIITTTCDIEAGYILKINNTAAAGNKFTVSYKSGGSNKSATVDGGLQKVVLEAVDNNTITISRNSSTPKLTEVSIFVPYTVTLAAGEGASVTPTSIKAEANEVVALPHPVKDGSLFTGWYDGETKVSDAYTVTKDVTLTAHYSDCPETGSVYKFEVKTGLANGACVETNTFDVTKVNYLSALDGGTLSAYNNNSKLLIASNNSFQMTDNSKSYLKVDLDCALEVNDYFKTTVAGNTMAITFANSQSTDYTVNVGTEQVKEIPAAWAGKKTLYLWRGGGNAAVSYFEIVRPEKVTVTFNSDGGSTVDAATIVKGAKVTAPTAPTKDNYSFVHWYKVTGETGEEDVAYDFDDAVNADMTLKAKWAAYPTLTLNRGTAPSGDDVTTQYAPGATVDVPACPFSYTGYTFAGWNYSAAVEITDGKFAMPSANLVLTALWEDANNVAQIGEAKYTSLAEALAHAADGEIVLLQDINVEAQVEIADGVSATIDLAGHKIEYTSTTTLPSGVILVHNGGSLTINDSSDPDAGSIVSGDKAYAAVALTKLGDDASNPATLVVNGGALTGYYYGITGNGSRNNTDITINGGTITGTVGIAIYHPQVGTLTINNGSLTGVDAAIEMRAGTLVINDGTFTATATEFSCNPNGSGSTTSGAAIAIAQHTTKKDINVTINGGTFNGVKALNESNPHDNDPAPQVTMAVTGGNFTGEVSTVDVNNFVSGGSFSEPVAEPQCATDYYPATKPSGKYGVTEAAVSVDFAEEAAKTEGQKAWATFLADNHYDYNLGSGGEISWDNANTYDTGLKLKKSTANALYFTTEPDKVITLTVGNIAGMTIQINGGEAQPIASGTDATNLGVSTYYSANAQTVVLKETSGSSGYNMLKSINIRDPYEVSFDENGGDAPIAARFGTPSVTLPSASKGTDSFVGWFDGETKIGEAGESYTPTADITLVAHWEAVSTDARLSAIEFSAVGTLSPAFDPDVVNYTYTMPYGTADVPTITGATAVNPNAQAPVIDAQAAAWSETAHVHGVAQSGATKDYYVQMLRAPKDGICIIKSTPTSGTEADVDGIYQGSAYFKGKAANKKLNSTYDYVAVELADGYTFQAGDKVVLNQAADLGDASDITKFYVFTEVPADGKSYVTVDNAAPVKGDNWFDMPADLVGASALYIGRVDSKCNPTVGYLAVYRPLPPVLNKVTVNGVEGKPNALKEVVFEVAASTSQSQLEAIAFDWISNNDAWTADPANAPVAANAWAFGVANTVTFTDKDGDQSVYTITVNKAAASTNVELATLTVDGNAIVLVPGQDVYSYEYPFGTAETPAPVVAATAEDANAEVGTITQAASKNGTATFTVTAENGTTYRDYTINISVSRVPKLVIYDGSTMTEIATSGSDVSTGFAWTMVGGKTDGGKDISVTLNGKTYTKSQNVFGSPTTSSTRYIEITIPEGYLAKFYLAGATNSSGETRSSYISKEKTGTLDQSIAYASTDSYDGAAMRSALQLPGTYYYCADKSIRLYELSVQLYPIDYSRDVTEGRYGTICLPQAGTMFGAELFEIAYYGETSHKIFLDNIPSGEMEAGVPYIFLPKDGVSKLAVLYTDDSVETAKSANGLIGFIGASADEYFYIPAGEGNYILQNNLYREVLAGGQARILSNRAYIKLSAINPSEPALAPGRRRVAMGVQSEQVATGCENLNVSDKPVKMIIDGQLFILRGEKMYDAKGQLVK